MTFRRLLCSVLVLACGLIGAAGVGAGQSEFQRDLAAKVQELEKKSASAIAGRDGWLFLTSELRFLAQGTFWGDAAAKTARSSKSPDPLPAIVDFHTQLRERGIELLLVPVPPKAAIYPEQIGFSSTPTGNVIAPDVQAFYDQLRSRGVNVLDLTATFAAARDDSRGPVYCRTDSHWSGAGTVIAAQAIAEQVRAKISAPPARKEYVGDWKRATVTGDLVALLPAGAAKPEPETLSVRAIAEKASGAAVQPDPNSPLLVLGDSHTLVFREFLAERAGLIDQLAHELGFAPDLIGTRGSGATAVRVSLYRKTRSDAAYLAKKKVIVWCFAAREFTEADQGWVPQPVAK